MTVFEVIGVVLFQVALLGYLNERFLKMSGVIGMTVSGILLSIGVATLGKYIPGASDVATSFLLNINFSDSILNGLLGVLLFAGAMHVDMSSINKHKFSIFMMATFGVIISTAIIGFGLDFILNLVGIDVPLIACLMLASLLSPTDPIAVMSIMDKAGVTESMKTKIVGESMFNDGTGVVVFMAILGVYKSSQIPTAMDIMHTFMHEVAGGVAIGVLFGYIGYRAIRQIDSYAIEIFMTLAMAIGGYAAAIRLGVSAPLAAVIMGLFVGNRGVKYGMSEKTRSHLMPFWELIDELLNLILFTLIGLVMMIIPFKMEAIVIGCISIPIVLLARYISVWSSLKPFEKSYGFDKNTVPFLTWGGLRGGISIALALSLPEAEWKPFILSITYIVVIFSLLVQATTLPGLMGRLSKT